MSSINSTSILKGFGSPRTNSNRLRNVISQENTATWLKAPLGFTAMVAKMAGSRGFFFFG